MDSSLGVSMPSEKLTRILLAKSPFPSDEITAMSEADGWHWVYKNSPPAKPKHEALEICFTGFGASERTELEKLASIQGMTVRTSVTTSLKFLCVGENAGPSKVKRAQSEGVTFLNREQFMELISDGVLPS
jgi:NAD-dependent DNA ligase